MVNSLFLAAAYAGIAVAAPAQPQGYFSVEQAAVNPGHRTQGAIAMMRTHQKYNKTPSPDLVKAAAAAKKTGSVVATSQQGDSEYTCPVYIAGSSTPLNLDFDTGSSDLWVFSTLQPASQTAGHRLYKPNPAKQLKGYTWDIAYGDGSGAAGVVYKDTVQIGGLTVTTQAVEAATSASSEFVQGPNDGLVGFAFDSLNTVTPTKQETFFDNISPSLASPIMLANLKYMASGSYDFGYIDPAKVSGNPVYIAADNSSGFWGVTYKGAGTKPGSFPYGLNSESAIVDTGTTLIYVGTTVLLQYYSQVSGASDSATYGGWVFPCSAKLPDWYVTVGGFTARVPGKYINYAPVATGSSTCFGGLQDDTTLGMSILGDVFIKSINVIFDNTPGKPRLGFVNKKTLG